MTDRVHGLDLARALAVIGMIIVNFKVVLGSGGHAGLKAAASVFDGKAAATFVVLAGIGIAMMTRTDVQSNDVQKLKAARIRLAKRAFFLFIIGLSYLIMWPADILHFYGVYMMVTLLFLTSKGKTLLAASIALIIIYPFLTVAFDYETGWDLETLMYHDFWTWKGFSRNLLYNGFHPVIPWTSFMLFGYWLGRHPLQDMPRVRRAFWVSGSSFLFIQLVSIGMVSWLADGDPASL